MTTFACLALSIGVFSWLKPNLGTMMGPVIAYVVIISAMAIGGIGAEEQSDARYDREDPCLCRSPAFLCVRYIRRPAQIR